MTARAAAPGSVDANQRYLLSAVQEVRLALAAHAARARGEPAPIRAEPLVPIEEQTPSAPAALEALSAAFELSLFERALLVLCAGTELDPDLAALCAEAHGDAAARYPTFSLALAALDGAHWDALTPDGRLRRWRLIEIGSQAVTPLTLSPLRIDERILHYLAGVQHLDERLIGLVEPVPRQDALVPSHQSLAARLGAAWAGDGGALPLIELCGFDDASKRAVAAAACAGVGLDLFALDAGAIPSTPAELEGLARLWEREAVLASSALYVAVDADGVGGPQGRTVTRFLERVRGPLLLGTLDRWRPLLRQTVSFEVGKPTRDEQRQVWQVVAAQHGARLNGHLDDLVSQFDLSEPAIRASVSTALSTHATDDGLADRLWDAGRDQARPRLNSLAQRIEPVAGWDDLVLPDAPRRLLEALVAQVAHRGTVYERWGFGAVSRRGLGISALFTGASGTGKTMAAEVLANALRLDLYRIDLSGVVSKYIGETEKNLRRVFDAAEDGGAILLFDEADALFGKRSEVKDSHDRYANIEINYLLQRMEAYRGVAVLATNVKGALDPAFLRRIRFVVNFPFPDLAQRLEIWRRVFPPSTPTAGLDPARLARLDLAGGNIHNIALGAAFRAAAAGEPVRMTHLAEAVRVEYAKLERPLDVVEIGGWA